MARPLQRIGILLAIIFTLLLIGDAVALAAPRSAKGGDEETSAKTVKIKDGSSKAATNSGKGMNRQGGPSTHPGKGWKDPGHWQGSPMNTADPDCTGNRSETPQETNIGACDTSEGTPDKPGGSGGFDSDKDWNNGCGNDQDFEDDNNGLCLGRQAQITPLGQPDNGLPGPPGNGAQLGPRGVERPTLRVLGGGIAGPPGPRAVLPVTGFPLPQLLLAASGLMASGTLMTRRGRRRK